MEAVMRSIAISIVVFVIAAGSLPVCADDAPSARPVKTHKQLMHDCMTAQASKNPSMAKADMQKTCRDKVQTFENHPSMTSPANAPTDAAPTS
jgi:hypothetical protein